MPLTRGDAKKLKNIVPSLKLDQLQSLIYEESTGGKLLNLSGAGSSCGQIVGNTEDFLEKSDNSTGIQWFSSTFEEEINQTASFDQYQDTQKKSKVTRGSSFKRNIAYWIPSGKSVEQFKQ
jgi:hypothetical protein